MSFKNFLEQWILFWIIDFCKIVLVKSTVQFIQRVLEGDFQMYKAGFSDQVVLVLGWPVFCQGDIIELSLKANAYSPIDFLISFFFFFFFFCYCNVFCENLGFSWGFSYYQWKEFTCRCKLWKQVHLFSEISILCFHLLSSWHSTILYGATGN